jgi:hypothetical protein
MAMQRPGNERAIARTTPARLSRYAIITLTAQLLIEQGAPCRRSTAWYRKTRPTFSDAMAVVRRQVWEPIHFSTALQQTDLRKMPRTLCTRFIDAVCYAASLDKVELRQNSNHLTPKNESDKVLVDRLNCINKLGLGG